MSHYKPNVRDLEFNLFNVLPRLSAQRKIVEAVDLSVMEIREESF